MEIYDLIDERKQKNLIEVYAYIIDNFCELSEQIIQFPATPCGSYSMVKIKKKSLFSNKLILKKIFFFLIWFSRRPFIWEDSIWRLILIAPAESSRNNVRNSEAVTNLPAPRIGWSLCHSLAFYRTMKLLILILCSNQNYRKKWSSRKVLDWRWTWRSFMKIRR